MASAQAIKYFFIRKLAKILINGLVWTCRVSIRGDRAIADLKKQQVPIVYIYWHRHIFFNVYKFKHTGARPLISLSADGEIISRIAREFGMEPIRGSSSRGGMRAFLKLLKAVRQEKSEILITADGPKGPARQIKDGTLVLAQKTGAAVVPIGWYASRVKIFHKTWDKFIIPRPFSRIVFAYDQPLMIPPDLGEEGLSNLKNRLQETLDNLEKMVIEESLQKAGNKEDR